jgi:hypothetical protein
MAEEKPAPSMNRQRIDGFSELYANNLLFEASVWDLKLIFGVLDQTTTPNTIREHASINIPWAQVKLMTHFLKVNLLIHERDHGKVNIPTALIPEPLEKFLTDWETQPGGKELIEKTRQSRNELL